jgi:hypothetical protein
VTDAKPPPRAKRTRFTVTSGGCVDNIPDPGRSKPLPPARFRHTKGMRHHRAGDKQRPRQPWSATASHPQRCGKQSSISPSIGGTTSGDAVFASGVAAWMLGVWQRSLASGSLRPRSASWHCGACARCSALKRGFRQFPKIRNLDRLACTHRGTVYPRRPRSGTKVLVMAERRDPA